MRKNVVFDKLSQQFTFDVPSKPDFVNVDAEKMLLCVKSDVHTNNEWKFLYDHGPLFMDRYESFLELSKAFAKDSTLEPFIVKCLDDPFWKIRQSALLNLSKSAAERTGMKEKLIKMAQSDSKSKVGAEAISALAKYFKTDDMTAIYEKALLDSSYLVVSEAMGAFRDKDSSLALQHAAVFEGDDSGELSSVVGSVYSRFGADKNMTYFLKSIRANSASDKFQNITFFGKFLLRVSSANFSSGIALLDSVARNEATWWVKIAAIQAFETLKVDLNENTKAKLNNGIIDAATSKERAALVSDKLAALKKDEKNDKLKKYYSEK